MPSPFDSNLQMYIEPAKDVDTARLAFLRWLAEQGRLEHEVAGPPSGQLVVAVEEPHA